MTNQIQATKCRGLDAVEFSTFLALRQIRVQDIPASPSLLFAFDKLYVKPSPTVRLNGDVKKALSM
jgi:hypothetical protein